MQATANTSALVAEFETERDRIQAAFDLVSAAVTAASYGIAGVVDNYGDLPAASGLAANTIYIVRNDAGAPSGNGLYWVQSGAWAFLDALNVQNASEVSYDNSTSGLAATDTQAAVDEVDGNVDTHVGDTANPHAVSAAQAGAEPANANIQAHISDVTTNPHAVTAAQASAEPANANIQAHISDVTTNPHAVTAAQVAASNDWTTPPTGTVVGESVFDTTAGKPYWWDGSQWVDATGGAHA
jgi:hypothetical protein